MGLELIQVPVSDIDRAKAFYVDQVGFNADHDHQVSDEVRFVQLTPPGSACSIALTTGAHQMDPGSVEGLQMVVDDAETARQELAARGGRGQRCPGLSLGKLRFLQRPRRQRLGPAGHDPPPGELTPTST
jgi:catechol 2,3-dioxygenase-like lactoylglutathione lyase family enzyme